MIVSEGEIGRLADHRDLEVEIGEPSLADARIDERRFKARIGADDQDTVGALNPSNAGIKEIAFASAAKRPDLAGNRDAAIRRRPSDLSTP